MMPHPCGVVPAPGAEPPPELRNKQCRHFSCTFWSDQPPMWNPSWMHYLVYQQEIAPVTGVKHWQTHIYTKVRCRFNQVRTLLGLDTNLYWIAASIYPTRSIEYCKKDETRVEGATFIEHGKQPNGNGSGKRTDLDLCVEIINEGGDLYRLAEECPKSVIQYHNGLQKLITLKQQHRTSKPECIIIYGPTNLGKTTWAINLCTSENVDYHPLNTSGKGRNGYRIWWDGYSGQHTVLIDEMDGDTMTIDMFKKLIDTPKLFVEVKGGTVVMNAKRFIFTSNHAPQRWWRDSHKVDYDAFVRRVDLYEIWSGSSYLDVRKETGDLAHNENCFGFLFGGV